jgi:peroxiredoxin Q/BCP
LNPVSRLASLAERARLLGMIGETSSRSTNVPRISSAFRRVLVALGTVVAAMVFAACSSVQRPDGGKGLLEVGAAAPTLAAVDHEDREVSLEASRGSPIVVYFYPKDGTPGCTEEACAFRDAWDRFVSAGVLVIGVSTDSRESHEKFATEHELPFSLVADEKREWSAAFGVESFMGMNRRVSFLIAPDGRIAKVYPDVDPAQHATEVLADAAALPAAAKE